jgi:predicted transcriptional regulator of viral defense system
MAEKRRTEGGHHALAELADRQYGVVSARQLRGLGYSYDAMADAAAAGRLHRLHRGVYAVGRRRLDWHGYCLAWFLAGAPGCASHAAAGWVWGLLRYAPEWIDVTARSRRHARTGMRVHYARLDRGDRVERDGIPVTSVARTQLDLAATLSPARIERLLERSEELRLFDLLAIEAQLARAAHHPGAKPLRRH